jgi:hypothetical protein
MGVGLRRDWDADVQLVGLAEAGATTPLAHATPARTTLVAKLLFLAAASGVTLSWIAFLCTLVARFFGSLF